MPWYSKSGSYTLPKMPPMPVPPATPAAEAGSSASSASGNRFFAQEHTRGEATFLDTATVSYSPRGADPADSISPPIPGAQQTGSASVIPKFQRPPPRQFSAKPGPNVGEVTATTSSEAHAIEPGMLKVQFGDQGPKVIQLFRVAMQDGQPRALPLAATEDALKQFFAREQRLGFKEGDTVHGLNGADEQNIPALSFHRGDVTEMEFRTVPENMPAKGYQGAFIDYKTQTPTQPGAVSKAIKNIRSRALPEDRQALIPPHKTHPTTREMVGLYHAGTNSFFALSHLNDTKNSPAHDIFRHSHLMHVMHVMPEFF